MSICDSTRNGLNLAVHDKETTLATFYTLTYLFYCNLNCVDPMVHCLTPELGVILPGDQEQEHTSTRTHGPPYKPLKNVFFILWPASNPQSVSILSSPIPMYRISCTCIFYAFLGALCSALFWRKPTQGDFWCLNIHLVSCILYLVSVLLVW